AINTYENFILLCANHHVMVDDEPRKYTKEILRELKFRHETRINSAALSRESFALVADFYLEVAEMMAEQACFDQWRSWAFGLTDGYPPHIKEHFFRQLDRLADYLEGCNYPVEVARLPWAFKNYCRVYRDFASHLSWNGHPDDNIPNR
ncbi:hypothetical protein ADL26_11455, partial [Thermoactinomyces vulgaris]